MLCNPVSKFPEEIDPMIFFQDVKLQKKEIMDRYNKLIADGRYSEANDFINQYDGIYLYSADFFNLIENRIYKLQSYLLNTKKPKFPFTFSDEKPSNIKENTIWV